MRLLGFDQSLLGWCLHTNAQWKGFWQEFNFKWNEWLELVHSGVHCMLIRFSGNSLDSRCCFWFRIRNMICSEAAWLAVHHGKPDQFDAQITATQPQAPFWRWNHHPCLPLVMCDFVLSACPLCPTAMSKVFSISRPILNSSICSALYQSFTTSVGTSGREDMFFWIQEHLKMFLSLLNYIFPVQVSTVCAQLNTA